MSCLSIPTPGFPHFYYSLGANLGSLLHGDVSVMSTLQYDQAGFKLGIYNTETFFSRFADFRKKFKADFHLCLYVLYIQTSPSAENREKWEFVRRLFLPSRPLACSLSEGTCHSKETSEFFNLWSDATMSHVTRKPVFGVCDQGRHKSACAATAVM